MKICCAIHITFLSIIILSASTTVCGFSTSSSSERPPRKDFATKIVEDAVVKDVSSKVLRRNKKASGINNPKPLNSREKSFTQRDPIISLNMNLDYLAKSGQRDAAKRCEEMLTRIEALHADGYYEKSPDVVSYNSVINSYAHGRTSPSPNSRSSNAKRLMKRMEGKGIQPNTITYNTLLRCIMKEIGEKPTDKIKEAETILRYMEEVNLANTVSYNTVISCISKSDLDDSAERAERWLQRMIDLYNENPQNDKIQPDTVSFNSVIHAYSNTPITKGAPERAKKAKELLNQMESLYKSGENDNVKPDTISYSAVVNSYAKCQNSLCAVKALALLEHMEDLHKSGNKDVKPNKRTYTSCINAFGRIGNPKAADDLLTKMKEQYKLGDVSLKPDTITYSSVLNAYARKGGEDSAYRADELLSEMFDLYNSGNYDVKPNTQIFRTVITALGKSKHSRAAGKSAFVMFYHVHMCVQCEVLVIWLLHLFLHCIHLLGLATHMY